jgi:PAS fold
VLFGLPPDVPNVRVHYDTFLAGLHPEDRDAVHGVTQAALDPAGSGEYDIEYRTIGLMDGIERWIAAKGRAFFEGAGEARRAVRFTGIVRDTGERKRTEAALRAGEERLRDLRAGHRAHRGACTTRSPAKTRSGCKPAASVPGSDSNARLRAEVQCAFRSIVITESV